MARLVDPFAELDRVFDAVGSQSRVGALMPMDAYEKDGVYTLRFDLAGAEPGDVDLTVEKGILTVRAERPAEDTEGVDWLVRERPTGTHSRQVRLGDSLDVDNVEADYERGVLTVRIPSRPDTQPRRISIAGGTRESGAR